MNNAFLSLGSNIGTRYAHLEQAILMISKRYKVISISSIYETEPLGKINQNNFYNMMIKIEASCSAHELLENCLSIEIEMGRIRERKWGPRLIDIDIISFGKEKINENGLNIPHPEFSKRKFVLEPFSEIATSLKINNRSVADYLEICDDLSEIKKLNIQTNKLSHLISSKSKVLERE